MDIVERARADVLRSGTWADTGNLILEMADEIEKLRRERDEAQSTTQSWQNVFECIKAHLQDRVAMKDEASPATYLQIIEANVRGILRESQQICAARWAEYARLSKRAEKAEAATITGESDGCLCQ